MSVLPEGAEREQTLRTLAAAAGYVRYELAQRLGLREAPEVRFQLDTSIERGARVEDILKRLERGEPVDEDEEG